MATLTVYPDPNTETTSVDGYVGRANVGASFSDNRDGAGTEANDSATTAYGPQIGHHTTTNTYAIIRRLVTLFDTSALTSVATISSAVLSYYFVTRVNNYTGGEYNCLVTSSPASNTALVNADYNVANFGTTELMTRQAWSAITLNTYTDWTLNASGIAAISKTGVTKFGVRTAVDLDNGATWQSGISDYLESNSADSSGTTTDPKLVITYTTSVDVSVSATVVSATLSAPASTQSGAANVASSVVNSTFSTPATSVSGASNVTATVVSATFSIPLVNIITPDAQIDASVVSATFSIPAMTVEISTSVSQGTPPSATFSIPASSVQIDFIHAADALSATFTTPAPTISAESNITVSPSALSATFSIPATTVTGEQNAMFEAGVLTATFSTQEVTVTAIRNITVDASVLSALFSIQTPRKVGGLWTAQPRVEGTWIPQARVI